jgi:choline-sulfatase
VDVARTIVDLGGGEQPEDWDGDTLLPLLQGAGQAAGGNGTGPARGTPAGVWKDEAICEYYGHATNRPHRMLRTGRWKYNYYHGETPELFDLQDDPGENHNLAGEPALAGIEGGLRRRVLAGWDPDEIEQQVRRSQRARAIIGRASGAVARRDVTDPAAPQPQMSQGAAR